MKNFDLNEFGLKEMNALELKEANGGGLREWIIGKAIDAAVKLIGIAAQAYIDYSAETGGEYVIHHAY
jgi:hypothetical protein